MSGSSSSEESMSGMATEKRETKRKIQAKSQGYKSSSSSSEESVSFISILLLPPKVFLRK